MMDLIPHNCEEYIELHRRWTRDEVRLIGAGILAWDEKKQHWQDKSLKDLEIAAKMVGIPFLPIPSDPHEVEKAKHELEAFKERQKS